MTLTLSHSLLSPLSLSLFITAVFKDKNTPAPFIETFPEDEEATKSLGDRLKAAPNWSKATALSLMLFVLLYSPCFVALVVIKQEAGSWKWLFFSMVFNTALAYGVALIGYRIGRVLWG